jgi:hypothetical protein
MMIVLPHRLESRGEADAVFAGKEQPSGLQGVAGAGVMIMSFAALLMPSWVPLLAQG